MRELQRRLARGGGAGRTQLLFTIGLGACATALIVAQATLLAEVITAAFLGGEPLGELRGELIWLAAIALARGLVGFGFDVSGRIGAARVMAELRSRLAERLLRERPGGLAEERRGELASAAVQGVDALEAYYARYLPQVALAALAPAVILIWVLPRNWQAAAILAVTLPLIPAFMVLIGKLAERSVRKRWRALSSLGAAFLDIVSGLETLRAFGRAEPQQRAIASASERYRSETMATLRVGFLSALVLELLAMLGTAMVAVTIGIQLADGSLGLEAGLTVLLLAPELYMPLRQLGAQFHASADGLAAAERIFEVLDLPPVVGFPTSPRPAPDPRAEPLRLEGVSFIHPGADRPVLDDATLELSPRESVALVGPSGCGKTTLAALLLRLADPIAGRVSCGGVDLREVAPADWRSRIGWVPQRPTIFAASVADNIRLADPAASEQGVRAAAQAAAVLETVDSLPDGLATRVGEGGRRLSAGQAQRIALARAFLGDPDLVVLDEPTAHLDGDGAAGVWTSLERLLRGRTALVIVHRLALARGVDRVITLRDGRLAPLATTEQRAVA